MATLPAKCLLCEKILTSHYKLKTHVRLDHKITWDDYRLQTEYNGIPPVCACGCGRLTANFSKFVHGHNGVGKSPSEEIRRSIGLKNSKNMKRYYEEHQDEANNRALRMREFITDDVITRRSNSIRISNTTPEYREKISLISTKMWEENPEKKIIAEIHRKETNLIRFGYENPFQSPKIQQKVRNSLFNAYGVFNCQQCEEIQQKTIKTCLERYGVKYAVQKNDYFLHKNISKPEMRIAMILRELFGDETIIQQYFINEKWHADIFISTHNICVEVDGTYWHRIKFSNQYLIDDEDVEGMQRRLRDLEENDWFCLQKDLRLLRINEDVANKITHEQLKLLVENCERITMTYQYID